LGFISVGLCFCLDKFLRNFDKVPKTDVYYEAQLIAAKQADGSGESR